MANQSLPASHNIAKDILCKVHGVESSDIDGLSAVTVAEKTQSLLSLTSNAHGRDKVAKFVSSVALCCVRCDLYSQCNAKGHFFCLEWFITEYCECPDFRYAQDKRIAAQAANGFITCSQSDTEVANG